MQPSSEEHTLNQLDATARRVAERSQSRTRQTLTIDSDLDATQTNLRNASSALLDTLNRLDQIRRALQELEPDESTNRGTEGRSAQLDAVPNSDSQIGPPHSAIVLSGGSNTGAPATETLRARINEFNAEFPEHMRVAANLMRNITLRTSNLTRDAAGSHGQSNDASRQAAEPRFPFRRSRTSSAVSGWYTRPRRDNNTTPDGGVGFRRQEINRDNSSANAPSLIHLPARDDDSASTLLGRRVASRSAAAGSSSFVPVQGPREPRAPFVFRRERNDRPLGNREASRVIVPPRLPDRVSRRIAQFELNVRDRDSRADSEGSETEVEDYVYRPVALRRTVQNDSRSRSIRQRRTSNGEPSARSPQIHVIPPTRSLSSSVFAEFNATAEFPRPADEERQTAVASRMHDVYGRLDRISSALSTRSTEFRRTVPPQGEDTNDALSQPGGGPGQGGNSYHEVLDEDGGRSYRIRRRVNANGDEIVHQIRTDDTWWGVDLSQPWVRTNPFDSTASPSDNGFAARRESEPWWLDSSPVIPSPPDHDDDPVFELDGIRREPRSPIYAGQSQRSETDLPPLGTDGPRETGRAVSRGRRGWARLNPDGDEIPTDEEEEIERLHTEQRIRDGQNIWVNTRSAYPARARLEYLAPTTRSVFSNATDDDEEENDVRVRLNRSSEQSARTSTFTVFSDTKAKESELETERVVFGTTEPYYLYPLPQRLEEMAPSAPAESPSGSQFTRIGLANLRDAELAARAEDELARPLLDALRRIH